MKYILIIITCFLFISLKPISLKDTEIEILYLCGGESELSFDKEGRKGLATLSELKRRESEKLNAEKGKVFLFGNGNNYLLNDDSRLVFEYLNKVPFNGVFLSNEELLLLEINPFINSLELPFLAHRNNNTNIPMQLTYKVGDVTLLVQSSSDFFKMNDLDEDKIDAILVFLKEDEFQDLDKYAIYDKPIIYFYIGNESSSISYKSNVYSVKCPNYNGIVGKLNLFFRNKELIRQNQTFLYLNTKEHHKSWIDPNREILQDLKN